MKVLCGASTSFAKTFLQTFKNKYGAPAPSESATDATYNYRAGLRYVIGHNLPQPFVWLSLS